VSLTTRLSAFFLGALALVQVGFSVSLYLLAGAHLHRQAQERVRAALDTLAAVAEVKPGGVEWEPHERHLTLGQDPAEDQVRWEIRDDRGRVVDRSANLGPSAPWAEGGTGWLVRQRHLEPHEPGGDGDRPSRAEQQHRALVLTVGLSLGPVQATARRLAGALAGLSVGLWLLAALLGRRLCRRALRPVSRMALAAGSMGAADLARRLPVPASGDEMEEMGRAFNGLLDRLQEAFERQQRFTGDASHQLRTPLTALRGQVEVTLRRDRPPEEYRRVLALVQGQAAHLQRIVEALLFLARADAEAEVGAPEEMDLGAWLPGHLRGWAAHARAADLDLVPPRGGPFRVRAQPVLLGQALDNLLDNALKYSEPGTRVAVSLRREGDAVVLEVTDLGEGIGEEDLPHVFEPFYRSAEARRRGRPGVGLGLAVVQRVAAALGGVAGAASRPGRGSSFTLRLPAIV
jgi:heavy metal sensor kinase